MFWKSQKKYFVTSYLRQQPLSVRGFPRYFLFKMADERKLVKNLGSFRTYKVQSFALSLNVEANLEARKNSAVGVES